MKAQNKIGGEVAADLPHHFWDLFLPWTPTMGTDLFPTQAFWMFQEGEIADVPVTYCTIQI